MNNSKKLRVAISIAAGAVVVAIIGCGGGGGASGTGTATATTSSATATTSSATATATATTSTATGTATATTGGNPFPISTSFRAIQAGDVWVYSLTVSRSVNGGVAVTGIGSRSDNVLASTLNGTPTLKHNSSDGYQLPGSNVAIFDDFFFKINGTGDILLLGDDQGLNGAVRTANTNPVVLPGTWGASTSVTSNTTLSPGGAFSEGLKVVAQEVVNLSIGSFTTWKTTVSRQTGTLTRNGTYWYSPKLGSYVQSDETTVNSADKSTTTIHATLTSSTVPLG